MLKALIGYTSQKSCLVIDLHVMSDRPMQLLVQKSKMLLSAAQETEQTNIEEHICVCNVINAIRRILILGRADTDKHKAYNLKP